ncbi:hypothetical protein K438DRAFT_1787347 [Mycena galopus ATCC 62051]|nr:hypothetical protein K438DRAFT_1787347 [Mycena galopus ATCC 62051]
MPAGGYGIQILAFDILGITLFFEYSALRRKFTGILGLTGSATCWAIKKGKETSKEQLIDDGLEIAGLDDGLGAGLDSLLRSSHNLHSTDQIAFKIVRSEIREAATNGARTYSRLSPVGDSSNSIWDYPSKEGAQDIPRNLLWNGGDSKGSLETVCFPNQTRTPTSTRATGSLPQVALKPDARNP